MEVIDGLNPGDPGIALLVKAIRGIESRDIFLVHSGDLPGLEPGAQRLILDVRERIGAVADTIEDQLGPISLPRQPRAAIVWPRAHLGKDFTRRCLVRAAQSVREGGAVWCAVRKSKGADTVADAMRILIGPVDIVGRSKGYRLFRAECTRDRTKVWAEVLGQRYTITDEDLLPGVSLHSAPGVFSRRGLDAGTAALMRYTAGLQLDAPKHMVDLCAGIGPLAIWAAKRWTETKVTAVDSNLLAVSLARRNVEELGLSARVDVLASDGLPKSAAVDVELALVNPPTHADAESLTKLWTGLRKWLAPTARVIAVATRPGGVRDALVGIGAKVESTTVPGYTIVDGRWG